MSGLRHANPGPNMLTKKHTAHMEPSQIRAVEFPGACAAGHTWNALKSVLWNFRVLVLLGAFGALSNPGG